MLETNQENQVGWGGPRPGSGRPKGSSNKPRISDYITLEEVKSLVNKAKELAPERPELMKFLLEQVFGKAKQNIDLGNADGEGLRIIFDSVFNATPSETTPNSPESSEIQGS